jgi:predicted RNA-binding Zn-ribbon protein involved in translation (DUF1610 family)
MSESTEIKLSLLDNSHAFLNEAVSYALSAQGDARKWQFAVLNLVQSLELSLKTLLHNIHPILVFDNVDVPKHTVGPLQALDRLNQRLIVDAQFLETERQRIKHAIDLRNQMTHSEFTLKPEYATAKFFETFGFVAFFQARHLKCEIDDIVGRERLNRLLAIDKGTKELAERASQRIEEEEIDSDLVLECPNCEKPTFVIQDDINTCYTCRHTEEIFECDKCGSFVFDWQLQDFSNEFDIDFCEGRTRVHNNFGYRYHKACEDCTREIRSDITQKRENEEYEREMERYYWEQMYEQHDSELWPR